MIGTLILNRYELLEKIGEGGMGTVYKAKCHLLNRFVAVKILKEELSNDDEFVTRFKREATSIAKLSHANIVNIHDVGEENHINFIIMEYINGKTLKQVIKDNGRLSSKTTLNIVLQITKALECAHTNNIIHRDIKPENIMITGDEIVKVMDFGIAKVVGSSTVTNSSKIMGTVHYFSPEQAKGNFVDSRTDIYSLGIVMYEMVTGRVPYNAESAITIAMMHIEGAVTPPIEINNDVPENINQVILRAMQKEPIKRYQTAKEMAKCLLAIKEDSNYRIRVNSDAYDATKIMNAAIPSGIRNDFTTLMSKGVIAQKTALKKDKEMLYKNNKRNKKINTTKKTIIIIASIILVMIASVLGKFLSTISAANASTATSTEKETDSVVENTNPVMENTSVKVSEEVPVNEMKIVPSLIGIAKDDAKQIITDNGFVLGKISNYYSNSIAQGLVISQSPKVNTYYDAGGKIDLVISKGKMVIQITSPEVKEEVLEKAEKLGEDIKKGIKIGGKKLKDNYPKN